MRSLRLLLALSSCLPLILIGQAYASLSISPLKFEYALDPGKSISDTVRLTNNSDAPLTLYNAQEDFVAGDESGTPKFVALSEQTSDVYSMAKWISVENANLTLAKGESRDVRFTIKVPKTAEPGGHYGAIFFSPGVQ